MKVKIWAEDYCSIKSLTDVEIFIECLDWVKIKGKEKSIEIRLNSNINEEQCNELLSLAIMQKIKANQNNS